MKLLKGLVWLLVILVLLVIIAAVCLVVFVKPNHYKPQIEKAFHQKTQMVLSLPGKLSWQFFPSIGIDAGQVDIAKKPGLKPFVSMSKVSVAIHPWSLLWGEVSHLQLNAGSFTYDKMHFAHTDMTINDLSANQSFPLSLKTTANLGLPKPLNIHLNTQVQFVSGEVQSLYLTHLKVMLNQSDLAGQVSVKDFNAPHIQLNLSSAQFNLQDFIDLKGAQVPLNGTRVVANLNAKGTDAKHFPSTLNGTMTVSVKHSEIKGVDVGETLSRIRSAVKSIGSKSSGGINLAGLAQIQSLLAPQKHAGLINPDNGKVTVIGQFNAKAIVKNGVIENHAIKVVGKHYNIEGAGYVNLNTQSLDYNFNLYGKHTESVKGKTTQVSDGYTVPFFIKGHFNNLQKGIDYPALSKQIQTLFVSHAKESAVSKISEKLGNHVPQGLKNSVNNLLNNFFGH